MSLGKLRLKLFFSQNMSTPLGGGLPKKGSCARSLETPLSQSNLEAACDPRCQVLHELFVVKHAGLMVQSLSESILKVES